MIRVFCLMFFVTLSECTFVHTTLGPVKGKLVVNSVTNATYVAFLGISYAEAPVNDLRFQPPVRKTPWHRTYHATRPGYVCPQAPVFHSREEMSEDCLNFNVYTPINILRKPLPVLVTIHGGSFNLQSGKAQPIYDPEILIQQDIIVVTLNYRLGLFGFLSFNTEKVPGNLAIKDVMLAIKIIRENISKFGGDVNRMTIRGTGAGAALINYLMVADLELNKKFQNAMLHSGNFLSPKYIQYNPRENAKLLADKLNITWTNDDDVFKQIASTPLDDLVEIETRLTNDYPRKEFREFRPFKPVIEPPHATAVITKHPLELMADGAISDMPVFIGFNDKEGYEMYPWIHGNPHAIKRINENFHEIISEIKCSPEERKNLVAKIKEFYFNGRNVSSNNMQGYYDMMTDITYAYSTHLFIKMLKSKIQSPVYSYLWGGDNKLNWFKMLHNITLPGTAHGDNLGYTYLTSVTKSVYVNLDLETKEALGNILKNMRHFLTYGKPPTYVSEWPDAGLEGYHVVQNNVGVLVVYHGPIPDRIGFWESIYQQSQSFQNSQLISTNTTIPTNQPIPSNHPTKKKNPIQEILKPVGELVHETVGAVSGLVKGLFGG